MSTDTPRPERVTLTDDDLHITDAGECCSDYCVADVHDLMLDQAERLVEVLAAREAVRAQIKADLPIEEISWTIQEALCVISGSGRRCEIHEARTRTEDGRCPEAHAAAVAVAARIAGGEQ